MPTRSFAACTAAMLLILAVTQTDALASRKTIQNIRHVPTSRAAAASRNESGTSCEPCARKIIKGKERTSRQLAKSSEKLPCHPKDYVDPKIARNYKAALRDMKRAGITPKINSVWRSSSDQAQLRKCSLSARCRGANPGLYRALPPGKSLHEAGFAVDIGGVAAGPRGDKRITPQGRRIVGIMRKNGFKWRYGLSDPAHFEADPTKHGYRSAQQAIARTQTTCQVNLARKKTHKQTVNVAARRSRAPSKAQLRAEARPVKHRTRTRA